MSQQGLTEEQKIKIAEVYQKTTDLNEIVKQVFDNPSIDARNKEGRLVRKYLIDSNLKFQTTRREKKEEIVFTEEQKAFILDQASKGASSVNIASLLFPNKEDLTGLSLESRAVFAVMQSENPDDSSSQDNNSGLSSYVAPKSPGRIVKKINDATGLSLEESKLNRQHKICVEKLGNNLANSRFVKIINNYLFREDRDLFEEEFIRLTWDKPDLTADEINLYMNVCKDVVTLETIGGQLNLLNKEFNVSSEQENPAQSVARYASLIKDRSTEYNQCGERIQKLIGVLQGNRSERIKNQTKQNASILAIVQLFQDEEERKNMVKIAEMQKALIKEEAERLEGMSEWKARILGIAQEDVI